MRNKPQELLKHIMEKPENMTMDQMENLVNCSLQFFNEYIELSKKGDKEAQEKALKELLEFKESLQGISQKISEETGLSPSSLFEYTSNSENFSKEQWDSMQDINAAITDFNTNILTNNSPETKKAFKRAAKNSKKQRIAI